MNLTTHLSKSWRVKKSCVPDTCSTPSFTLRVTRRTPLFKRWHELKGDGGSEGILNYFEPVFRCSLEIASAPKPKEDSATPKTDEKVRLALESINDPAGFLAIPDKDEHAFDQATLNSLAALADALAEVEKNEPDTPSIMGSKTVKLRRKFPFTSEAAT